MLTEAPTSAPCCACGTPTALVPSNCHIRVGPIIATPVCTFCQKFGERSKEMRGIANPKK